MKANFYKNAMEIFGIIQPLDVLVMVDAVMIGAVVKVKQNQVNENALLTKQKGEPDGVVVPGNDTLLALVDDVLVLMNDTGSDNV